MFSKLSSSLPRGFTLVFFIAQLLCACIYGTYLWDRPHYQFFPIAALFAAWTVWYAKKEVVRPVTFNGSILATLLVVCILLIGAAVLLHSYWLMGFELLWAMVAVIVSGLGWKGLFRCLPAIALVAVCLFPAFNWDYDFLTLLRSKTTKYGSNILYLIDIPHILNGSNIDTMTKSLFVDEACSGINSFFSVLVFTLIWCALRKFPWYQSLLLCLCGALWAVIVNVFRVVLIAWALVQWNLDLTFGPKHEMLGMLTFAAALLLTWNSRQIVLFFTDSIKMEVGEDGKKQEIVDSVSPKTFRPKPVISEPGFASFPISKRFGYASGVAALVLSLAFMLFYGNEFLPRVPWVQPDLSRRILKNLDSLENQSMPREGKGWQLKEFEVQSRNSDSLFGEKSASWRGNVGPYNVAASVDYPFPHWHDLTLCYYWQGWTTEETSNVRLPGQEASNIRRIRVARSGYEKAYLFFGGIDPEGQPVTPLDVQDEAYFRRPDSLLSLLSGAVRGDAKRSKPQAQIQVFLLCGEKLEPSIEEAVLDLLGKLSDAVSKKIR